MPVYNAKNYIGEAIESILNQTFPHFEFIIVDDCSTDDSWEIICKYADSDKRIIISRNNKNLGIARTRNKCFSLRSPHAKYCTIMDADDISFPKRLESSVTFLENNEEFGVVGGNIVIIDGASKEIGKRVYSGHDVSRIIYIKSPFAQPSVTLRNSVLEFAGTYDSRFEVAEDLDLWFRFLEHSKGHNLNDSLLKYRINSNQSKNTKLKKTILNTIKIKQYYLKKHKKILIAAYFRIFFELFLLLIPNSYIMKLFYKLEIQK